MWLKISNCRNKVGQKFRNKWFILANLEKMLKHENQQIGR